MGIAVGNGWVDPIHQLNYADLLYQLALVDETQRDNMTAMQVTLTNQINNRKPIYISIQLIGFTKPFVLQLGKWLDAFFTENGLMDGDLGQSSLFNKYTGLNFYLNFLYTNNPIDSHFVDYLNLPSTRQAIGVGNVTFSDGQLVEYYMREDICQSMKSDLEGLINLGYSVLLYNGQLDLICAPILTETMIDAMNWNEKLLYDKAPKEKWFVSASDKEIAGYRKKADNFEFIVLRNAGHMTPYDQPRSTYSMITDFVDNL